MQLTARNASANPATCVSRAVWERGKQGATSQLGNHLGRWWLSQVPWAMP